MSCEIPVCITVGESIASVHGKQKAFRTSNLTVDEVDEVLQSCESKEGDVERSDSDSYSDTVLVKRQIGRNNLGFLLLVRHLSK
jgi:hypothetical protein